MNKPSAIRATYSDWKLVRTRQIVQIVFEVPLAEADLAYEVLGGMPNPASEQWFAIAPIDLKKKSDAKQPREWRELPPTQQAGIRCGETSFIEFIRETRPDEWHDHPYDVASCVRLICGVASRSELSTNPKARVIWMGLDASYQAWQLLPRVS
jgi:hypothetical protein